MAERALLACQRDGRYALFRSRWGGSDRALAAVCAGVPPGALDVTWTGCSETVTFRELLARLDYLSTAVVYRVAAGETTAFVALWFGLPFAAARPSPTLGALVAVSSLSGARTLRRQFRALKGRLADELVAGRMPASVAPAVLVGSIASLRGRERYVSRPGRYEPLCSEAGPDDP